MTLDTAADSKYVPNFPHRHYHSYAVLNGKMVDINPVLRTRSEDVALICNQIGAREVLDVGSNLGGFLFYLEQFAGFRRLVGIEGDARFVADCLKVADLLGSHVQFIQKSFMSVTPPQKCHDSIILQNVYHYLYDKIGDHEKIFRHLAAFGRSIIWYNPMDTNDPVIPAHAQSNSATDWNNYNQRKIFEGAIRAGFLHPLPLELRYDGMGESRTHLLFVRDDIKFLQPSTCHEDEIDGDPVKLRDHFKNVHEVRLGQSRSFKRFLIEPAKFMHRIQRLVTLGVLDESVCPDLRYIGDDAGNLVGYSQPRGVEFATARGALHMSSANRLYRMQIWVLISRMLRHDVFNIDVGEHNFVFLPHSIKPIMIDIEPFVLDASQGQALSIYHSRPNLEDIVGVQQNFNLIFPDLDIKIDNRNPMDVLWDAMSRSIFLKEVDKTALLDLLA